MKMKSFLDSRVLLVVPLVAACLLPQAIALIRQAPPGASPPPGLQPDTERVQAALNRAMVNLRLSADAAYAREVALLDAAAARARNASHEALRAELHRAILSQNATFGRLLVDPAGLARVQQAAVEEARRRYEAKEQLIRDEATEQAAQAMRAAVENATNLTVSASLSIGDEMQSEANTLKDTAAKTAEWAEDAARTAESWAESLPSSEARIVTQLSQSAINIALGLQRQAQEAGKLDKMVHTMVEKSDKDADTASQLSGAAMDMAMQAINVATTNTETLLDIKSGADRLTADAEASLRGQS